VFAELEAQALAALRQEGHRPDQARIRRQADLRYAGQAYELTVPVASGALGPDDLAALLEEFGQEHLRTYGHRAVGEAVDLFNLRVAARAGGEGARGYDPAAAVSARAGAPAGCRPAYFGREHGLLPTPVLSRADLGAAPRAGPLIVEEYDA